MFLPEFNYNLYWRFNVQSVPGYTVREKLSFWI